MVKWEGFCQVRPERQMFEWQEHHFSRPSDFIHFDCYVLARQSCNTFYASSRIVEKWLSTAEYLWDAMHRGE